MKNICNKQVHVTSLSTHFLEVVMGYTPSNKGRIWEIQSLCCLMNISLHSSKFLGLSNQYIVNLQVNANLPSSPTFPLWQIFVHYTREWKFINFDYLIKYSQLNNLILVSIRFTKLLIKELSIETMLSSPRKFPGTWQGHIDMSPRTYWYVPHKFPGT